MRFSILSVVAIASSCVAAVGNAVVKNTSTSKIYVWSVGDSIGTKQVVAPGGTFTEALHRAPQAGGIALKITKVDDGLFTSAPTQIFSYSLDGEQVWYDLSTVFGDPFKGQRLTVTSASGQTINWPQGTNPGGSQVKVAKSSDNVVFTVFATA